MLFALSHLFILSLCISALYGNDVTETFEGTTSNTSKLIHLLCDVTINLNRQIHLKFFYMKTFVIK